MCWNQQLKILELSVKSFQSIILYTEGWKVAIMENVIGSRKYLTL